MTVAEFKKKWLRYKGKETSAYPHLRRNKDLGRVLAIAALTGDNIEDWPARWETALRACFPSHWKQFAATAGDGLRQLLARPEDMEEAAYHCANGLLSRRVRTRDQLHALGRRLLAFTLEPLEAIGRRD